MLALPGIDPSALVKGVPGLRIKDNHFIKIGRRPA